MALYGFDHSVFKNIQSLAEIGFYFVQFRVDVIDAMELPFNERNALRILGIFLRLFSFAAELQHRVPLVLRNW